MIRIVLADDDVLDRQRLGQVLKEIVDVEVVGECASVRETIEFTKLVTADLLFLDIQMSDIDGFDVAEALLTIPKANRPQIAIVAANERYALRAFEIHAIDYVLKPYTVERIRNTVDRVRERQSRSGMESGLRGAGANLSNGQVQKTSERYATRLIFKSRGRLLLLHINEIRWIRSEQNYVRISTVSESHLLRETIGNLENRLDPHSFLRVHRSTIVNLHYVKEVRNEPGGDASAVLTSGDKMVISRSYKARIQKLLKG